MMVMVLGPAAGAFITNGVAIRPKVSVRAATPLAVLDPLPPEAFYIPAQQATSSGGGLDVVSLVAVLSIAYLAVSLMGPAEDTIASEKKPVQPKKSNFGWLNADMRVPPPKYEQLSDACHLIGADGRNQLFLCSAQVSLAPTPCLVLQWVTCILPGSPRTASFHARSRTTSPSFMAGMSSCA